MFNYVLLQVCHPVAPASLGISVVVELAATIFDKAVSGVGGDTPGNGLDQIQIQLDFGIWILLDLNLVGYGHPFALDLIGLDFIE